jgi:hypothetical protein
MSSAGTNTPPQSLASPAAPVRRSAPFGPPPLIEGEDRAAYDELLAQISAAVKPADILEDIWVRDIVDLVWEIFRLRRLKVDLMAATASKGLQKMLEPFSFEEWQDLAGAWAARKPDAIERVNRLLASAGLTMDAFMLQSLCGNLDAIECIERMIAMAEARRNDAVCEIERHRATVASTRRRTVQQVEAEYQAGAAKSAEQKRVV